MKNRGNLLANLALKIWSNYEVPESKSACLYRSLDLFGELLPMTNRVRVMLPLDYDEKLFPMIYGLRTPLLGNLYLTEYTVTMWC